MDDSEKIKQKRQMSIVFANIISTIGTHGCDREYLIAQLSHVYFCDVIGLYGRNEKIFKDIEVAPMFSNLRFMDFIKMLEKKVSESVISEAKKHAEKTFRFYSRGTDANGNPL